MGIDGDSNDSFAHSLQELKQCGSNLLVVGSPATEARQAMTRRLLGDGVEEMRRRLFVFTDATHTDARIGQGHVTPETVRVVDRSTQTRNTTAAVTGMSTPERYAYRHVDSDELGSLAWHVGEEIATFDTFSRGLSSGELRLCFDSLTPLLSDQGVESVRRFVGAVGNRTRSVGGMAHYHLPVSRTDTVVDELAPLFDAVITLRVRDGLSEHRWELCQDGTESTWIPL